MRLGQWHLVQPGHRFIPLREIGPEKIA